MDTQLLLYATDLTNREWTLLEPLLPPESPIGRPVATRAVPSSTPFSTNCVPGGAWRFLPQEWPPWQTVYHYFRRWRLDGTWERIHTTLRLHERLRLGRHPQPSAGSWTVNR